MAAGYTATTRAIVVAVQPSYLDDQSEPDEGRFVWAYRVRIHNGGTEPVQLIGRTWRITDARGRTITVEGAGVVGEQPSLEPGESFEYTSGTPLETSTGFMEGCYHMVVSATGESFDVAIPAFQPGLAACRPPAPLTGLRLCGIDQQQRLRTDRRGNSAASHADANRGRGCRSHPAALGRG